MTDYTLTIPAAGSYGADTLSADFTNPAATVTNSGGNLYLAANNLNNYVVKSIGAHDTRDMEVTTWVSIGYVFLRLDATGKALYFLHNNTGNGSLDIGITTGLTESGFPSGTQYVLYRNTNLTSSVTGYSTAYSTGDAFTFGVSGFDIYVEYNPNGGGSVEFCRFKEYRHMASGAVALKTASVGFRDIVHTTLSTASLASNYAANEINMGDWWMRALATTGSISASSNSLSVANATGFRIGDYIVVESGTESPGAGARGTIGVGGNWPSLRFATTSQLLAATPANYTFAWAQDTGQVWRYGNPGPFAAPYTGTWNQDFPWGLSSNMYYAHRAIPRSLLARITNIVGNTITLDTAASANASSANVYLDNQLYLNDFLQDTRTDPSNLVPLTPSNLKLIIPAGSFCLAGTIRGFNVANRSIQGAGQNSTFLFGPRGVKGASLLVSSSPNFSITDLTLNGNFFSNEVFALNWYDTIQSPPANVQYLASGIYATNRIFGQVGEGPAGIADFDEGWPDYGIRISQCNNAVVRNVTVNDVMMAAIELGQSDNSWGYDCTINSNTEQRSYLQWQFNLPNATNCGFQDCTFIASALRGGYAVFGTLAKNSFIRCTSINGFFDVNGATDPVLTNCSVTLTARADTPPFTGVNGPIVAMTTNTGPGSGGTVTNMTIVQEGYIGTTNEVLRGIVVGSELANVSIIGGSYTAPNWIAPSAQGGPIGIGSDGPNTSVSCFSSFGTVKSGSANILLTGAGSSCVNSRANVIVAPTQSGNVLSNQNLPSICFSFFKLADRVLDFGLNVLDAEPDRVFICSDVPITYAQATQGAPIGFALGNRNFGIGGVTDAPSQGFPNGRAVFVPGFTDGTITASGTAVSWAIVDTANQRLLAVGPLLQFNVTFPGTFTLSEFDINMLNQ